MLGVALRFPAGRYHATPWGKHVNEGGVAWPPEPWRLYRTLVATWHRKFTENSIRREDLTRILGTLAAVDPVFHLPPAIHAHSRHYMPQRKGGNDRAEVLDAFARIDAAELLIVAWPDVELEAMDRESLDALWRATGYLGRAESWVDAAVTNWNGEPNCYPGDVEIDPDTGADRPLVDVLAPRPPGGYADLRERIARTVRDRDDLKPRERRAILATLPEDWLTALEADTADLRQARWDHPPASRRVTYVQTEQTLHSAAPPIVRRGAIEARQTPQTTARFAVYGKPLPRIEDSVRVGEWLRRALMGKARWLVGEDAIPIVLSGHGIGRNGAHEHAFFLPEDADGDGRIDHLLLHADMELDISTRRVVDTVRFIIAGEGSGLRERTESTTGPQSLRVVLEGIGPKEQWRGCSRLLSSGDGATVWESMTPYLHPWFRKRNRLGPDEQVARECRQRGLPEPEAIEPLSHVAVEGRRLKPIHFHRFRSKAGLSQPDTQGSFWRLTFSEPLPGPLALGFGCHFGLGLFRPL